MNEIRKKQPGEFWKMFKHKKQTPTESEISAEKFYQYFKSLSNQDPPNRACSLDTILNENLKESVDLLLTPLETLFNYILNKKSFPKQ